MKHCFAIVLLVLAACVFGLNTAAATLPAAPAITVGTAYLFPDTSLSAATSEVVREGTLLEILHSTATESLDKDQNQQFRWHFARTADGRQGWLFGDGVALCRPADALPDGLRALHRQPVALGLGYENATLWFAAIEGHDSKEYHHVFFGEYYLVATNAAGRSVFLRYAGTSAQGETQLRQFFLQDLTGDGYAELTLETARREAGEDAENRALELFNLQNTAFQRVFSENLTLTDGSGLPAPALFKCVDLEMKTIRVEYVDYLPCGRAALPLGMEKSAEAGSEQCVEFVTYTYAWAPRSNAFQLLYQPTRAALAVVPLNFGVSIRAEPALAGEVVSLLTTSDRLAVVRQVDKITLERGAKKAQSYLYVRAPDGKFGYVSAGKVQWQMTRHAPILEAYGQKTPLIRSQWRTDFPFVRLRAPSNKP